MNGVRGFVPGRPEHRHRGHYTTAMKLLRPPRPGDVDRLLLSILRGPDADDTLATAVNRHWPEILATARRHNVHSLAAYCLTHQPGLTSRLAPATHRSGRDVLQKATLLNMFFEENLRPVVASLGERGIPAVLLKGVALLRTVYPHPGSRLSRDVDILVDTRQIDAALEGLLALGFCSELTLPEHAHYASRHFHFPLHKGSFVVELHWELVRPDSPYRLPACGVIERSLVTPSGNGLRLESPEDQLLHAASQSLSGGFAGLLRVCDVHMVLKNAGASVDWDALAGRARDGRLAPALALLVELDHRLLGGAVPDGARLLDVSRRVFAGVEPLQPATTVLCRFSKQRAGFAHLLRFWLLPGARWTVVSHFLFRHPRDRTLPLPRPGGVSALWRLLLVGRRALILLGLALFQVAAIVRRRRDDL